MNQPASATSKTRDKKTSSVQRPSEQSNRSSGSVSSLSTSAPDKKTLRQQEDTELVAWAQGGSREAFHILFERYHERAYAVAIAMVRNPQDAQDVLQEAFVKAHRYLPKFQGNSSFYTWFYRIVTNVSIDHIRKAKRTRTEEYEPLAERQELEAPPGSRNQGVSPQKSALRAELQQQIASALEELPEHHRAVIVLREVEELSYEEIATTLGLPKGTVMSRLFHARRKMQEHLAPYLATPPWEGVAEKSS